MPVGNESHTALITAFSRAYHARHAELPMFHDDLAESMLAPGAYEFLSTSMAKLLPLYQPETAAAGLDETAALAEFMRLTGWTTLMRSRFTEDHLETAVRAGTGQYLILGAGLDTFIFRKAESMGRLRVFELDHPATQEFKRERIAALGWLKPDTAYYVPIDFTSQRVDEVLGDTAFDPTANTFVSWLGVTYYLSREVVLGTLRTLAGVLAPGSTIVFDYYDHDALDPDRASHYMRRMQELVGRLGEPILSTFDPGTLSDEIAATGCEIVDNLGPAQLQTRYFEGRTDRGTAPDHVHLARAMVI